MPTCTQDCCSFQLHEQRCDVPEVGILARQAPWKRRAHMALLPHDEEGGLSCLLRLYTRSSGIGPTFAESCSRRIWFPPRGQKWHPIHSCPQSRATSSPLESPPYA